LNKQPMVDLLSHLILAKRRPEEQTPQGMPLVFTRRPSFSVHSRQLS
jgi:hypothetical protein